MWSGPAGRCGTLRFRVIPAPIALLYATERDGRTLRLAARIVGVFVQRSSLEDTIQTDIISQDPGDNGNAYHECLLLFTVRRGRRPDRQGRGSWQAQALPRAGRLRLRLRLRRQRDDTAVCRSPKAPLVLSCGQITVCGEWIDHASQPACPADPVAVAEPRGAAACLSRCS